MLCKQLQMLCKLLLVHKENSNFAFWNSLEFISKQFSSTISLICGFGILGYGMPAVQQICYYSLENKVIYGHGTTDWFQIGKGVRQGCILSPCLFNFYAEYIMTNAGLEETQAGIKIAGTNINNLRYADGIILKAESKEELKSLLMKVKEE